MLLPAREDLEGVIGRTWNARIELFSDDAETAPYNLTTAYDLNAVTLEIDGLVVLTTSSGLTVDGPNGTIDATMTPVQTAAAKGTTEWRLNLPQLDGVNEDTPMNGLIRWRKP